MIIMDTCTIIWDALDPGRLSAVAKAVIDNADKNNALIISDISIWEIAMLIKNGRIEIESTAANFINLFLQSRNIAVKPITPEIAELSVNFNSAINNDTADRLIAATSIIYKARLVTADQNLLSCEMLDTIW